MSPVREMEGGRSGKDLRIAVVAARFNGAIVDRLLEGALAALRHHGVPEENITVVRVPGAFELPVAAARLAANKQHEAIIALGVVIRGETPHFDYVAGECARGLGQVALTSGVPIAFGVLTTDTVEQAAARAMPVETLSQRTGTGGQPSKDPTAYSNKGAEAAECALEMANLLRRLEN